MSLHKSRIEKQKSNVQADIEVIFRVTVSVGKETDGEERQIQHQRSLTHVTESLECLSIAHAFAGEGVGG